MAYSNADLKEKIMEMYPEIRDNELSVGLVYDEEKKAYIVTFARGGEALSTHLEKRDADECMNGIKCVYFGIQIAQFIRNFGERERFKKTA